MPEVAIEQIASALAEGRTLAGLDLGTRTIGVAVCDPGLSFAAPRPVIRRGKFAADIDMLTKRIAADRVGGLIIGLPLNMDGTQGPRAQATRAFARNMDGRLALPFAFWDERLSTVAAQRALIDRDVSRKKRGERIDSAAAAFILQGALDRLYSAGAVN